MSHLLLADHQLVRKPAGACTSEHPKLWISLWRPRDHIAFRTTVVMVCDTQVFRFACYIPVTQLGCAFGSVFRSSSLFFFYSPPLQTFAPSMTLRQCLMAMLQHMKPPPALLPLRLYGLQAKYLMVSEGRAELHSPDQPFEVEDTRNQSPFRFLLC